MHSSPAKRIRAALALSIIVLIPASGEAHRPQGRRYPPVASTSGSGGGGSSQYWLTLDATNEHVLYPDNAGLDFTTAYTQVFWARRGTHVNASIVADKSLSGGYAWRLQWVTAGPNQELSWSGNGSGNIIRTNDDAGDPDNAWHNWVIVYDGSIVTVGNRVSFWRDCASRARTAGGTPPASLTNSAQGIMVGASVSAALQDTAQMAFWPIAATAGQVAEICNITSGYDATSLGAPVLWFQPDSDDTIGAGNVTDHGSIGNPGTATNMEAGDFQSGTFP